MSGQLQRWATGSYVAKDVYPANDSPALSAKVARLADDMVSFAEPPKDVVIQDENGKPLTYGDNGRRFFEASWMHKYNGTYYFSYSTGDTHTISYAMGKSPYGPFTYKGVILQPVLGKDFRGVGGHEDDPLAGAVGQDLLGELHTIGLRHDHVEQH